MNVTCTGCPAKYAVLDEKVRGKKVRIACKHCGTNILVDGTKMGDDGESAARGAEPEAAALSTRDAASAAPDAMAAKPKAAALREISFLVGFLDDRQESHTVSQIVDMYRTGQIDDEALLWKDGMADWLSPFDVPEIASAMLKSGVARRVPNPVSAMQFDDEATRIRPSPLDSEAVPAAPVASFFAPAQASPIQAAIAARRTEKRAAAVDLFGAQAGAGGENDASLDFGVPGDPGHKLTGARNESSVLFSLDALTKLDAKANQTQKARDKEQEKQVSAALFGDGAPDSMMNVGGGGLAELAAPDFTKPVTAAPGPDYPSNFGDPSVPRPKQKGGMILLVALLGIGGAAGLAFAMMQKKPLALTPGPPAADVTAIGTAVQGPAEIHEPQTKLEPSAAPSTAASAAPDLHVEAVPSVAPPTLPRPGPGVTPGTARPIATPAAANPGRAAPEKPAPEKPAPEKPAPEKPSAPAADAEGPAFDKAAAVAALGSAAAGAGSCKKPDGPTGTGKVSVTFAPSGRATATNVVGALAGTEVGGCVARLFRSARVPPFSGDPVTVSKSFSIE